MQAATIKTQPDSGWFSEAHGIMKDIENKLLCPEALRADHSEVEALIETQTFELMRSLFQAHLDFRAACEHEVEVRSADGTSHKQVCEATLTHGEDDPRGAPRAPRGAHETTPR